MLSKKEHDRLYYMLLMYAYMVFIGVLQTILAITMIIVRNMSIQISVMLLIAGVMFVIAGWVGFGKIRNNCGSVMDDLLMKPKDYATKYDAWESERGCEE